MAAFSLPPWGWWPLGLAGAALLAWAVRDLAALGRALVGAAFGAGLFGVGLWWMNEFHVVGASLAILVELSFYAVAALLVPRGRWGVAVLPAALVLAEAARAVVPFGGVPLAGLALGQVGGPLAGAARLGGELLVLGLVGGAGVGLAALARRQSAAGATALALVTGIALVAAVAPDGGGGSLLDTAVVQGGGRRGFRGVESDPQAVLDAQAAAHGDVRPPVALVLWPEDVVDVSEPVEGTPAGRAVAEAARRSRSTLVAGVIEDSGPDHFTNAAVAWSPAGEIVDRFEKVERVPFGEYIPLRGVVERLADVSVVPRDAVAGRGSGLLRTPAGRLGVTISYEVFFSSRGRAAARAGAEVMVVPTNAASFSGGQLPAQEVAAARLRAVETGRDLVQAAPTGYSAFITPRGRVVARTALGRRQVVQRPVALRSGRTVYVALGDWPLLALSATALALAWARSGSVRRT